MANIYLQKEFLPHNENRIKAKFNIPSEQKLICTVGLNRNNKYNFVLTTHGLYWKRILENKTTIISSILKSNYNYIETDSRITVETDESKHISLVIKNDMEGYSFALNGADFDVANSLGKIIRTVYNDGVIPDVDGNVKIIKPSVVAEKFCSGCDKTSKWIENFENKIVEQTTKIEENKKSKKAEKSKKTVTSEKSEKKEKKEAVDETIETVVVKHKTPFRVKLANFLDVIASLCFVAAIIFIFKPELINNCILKQDLSEVALVFQGWISTTGQLFLRFEPGFVSPSANFILGILVFTFFLLKLITIFLYKNKTKIVSIILLIMTGLTCFLLKREQIVLAIIFIVLLYLCFQLLSSVKIKTILKKILAIIILSLVEYVLLHLFMMPSNIEAMKQIGNGFKDIFRSLGKITN